MKVVTVGTKRGESRSEDKFEDGMDRIGIATRKRNES